MGFDGVVVTDDLRMGAIADHYTYEDAVTQAVLAGADILALSHDRGPNGESLTARAIDHLLLQVDAGVIDEERIHEAYVRIMNLKGRVLPAPLATTSAYGRCSWVPAVRLPNSAAKNSHPM